MAAASSRQLLSLTTLKTATVAAQTVLKDGWEGDEKQDEYKYVDPALLLRIQEFKTDENITIYAKTPK